MRGIGSSSDEARNREETYLALVDGPYGGIGTDFAAFDTAILIAASTGVTFTLPVILDLAHRTSIQQQKLPLRRLTFIWVMKYSSSKDWASSEISLAIRALRDRGIDGTVEIFVTLDHLADDISNNLELGICKSPDFSEGGCIHSVGRMHNEGEGREFDTHARKASEAVSEDKKLQPASEQGTAIIESNQSSSRAISLHFGRPNTKAILSDALAAAEGEIGVAVCGPSELSLCIRRDVVALTAKGIGGPGVYLHTEDFGW